MRTPPQPVAIRLIQALIDETKRAGITHIPVQDLETALTRIGAR